MKLQRLNDLNDLKEFINVEEVGKAMEYNRVQN